MKKTIATTILTLTLIIFLIQKQELPTVQNTQPYERFINGYFFDKGPESDPETTTSPYTTLTWKNSSAIEKSERISIDMNYPQFEGESKQQLNQFIKNYFNETISEYRQELKGHIKNQTDEAIDPYKVSFVTQTPLISVKNNILSMEIVAMDYSGGGNGNHSYSYPILWDLEANKLITQDKLFCSKDYLNKIAVIAQKIVLETIENHPNYKLDPELTEDIKNKTEPLPENYEILLPYNDGLVAVFQPYVLLGGAAGTIRIFIPGSEIEGLLCV